MNTVLVYKSNLLPYTETFIKEQVLAYRRWRGVLVGMRRFSPGLDLDSLEVVQLRPDPPGMLNHAVWKLSRAFGTLPPHVLKQFRDASLVHAHFGPDALEAWPLAQALNLPMLVTLHGYDINIDRGWWEQQNSKWMRTYPARLLELSRHPQVRFIAVSKAIRDRAIAYGIPADKVSIHYTGVDLARFAPGGLPIAKRERRVLFVGRLVEKKGCEFLIKAFAQVQGTLPDAVLIIAGDGALSAQLQHLALRCEVRAHFLGRIPSVEVSRELSKSRVLCLPSITTANGDAEGLGMVVLEAQASGVPVVTSARGAVDEAIRNGMTGFAFREGDVTTLTSLLIRLLSDDELCASMAMAARQFVMQDFDLHRCTERLELFYDAVLKRHCSGSSEEKI